MARRFTLAGLIALAGCIAFAGRAVGAEQAAWSIQLSHTAAGNNYQITAKATNTSGRTAYDTVGRLSVTKGSGDESIAFSEARFGDVSANATISHVFSVSDPDGSGFTYEVRFVGSASPKP
jgi:hypothetical protein